MDARNVIKPEAFEIKAPHRPPNVVMVLIDHIGFGATSTFGGAIKTPAFDQLAENGLRFFTFRKKSSQYEFGLCGGDIQRSGKERAAE